jgi:hypothetical protein
MRPLIGIISRLAVYVCFALILGDAFFELWRDHHVALAVLALIFPRDHLHLAPGGPLPTRFPPETSALISGSRGRTSAVPPDSLRAQLQRFPPRAA